MEGRPRRGSTSRSSPTTSRPTAPIAWSCRARVRTAGLSDAWEIELPHVPFNFDFDPVLRLDAILTLSDAVRDEAMARAIRLEPRRSRPSDGRPAPAARRRMGLS